RVGWNGGLGGWAERQCRGYMDFALFIHSAQYAAEPQLRTTNAPYRVEHAKRRRGSAGTAG
ncbi:MAG: hypothetical protein NTX45_22615, partial [Proteobacteria bacterium]|nr:hypothetical protein [Pseudomonadota bacterium]